MLLKLAAGFILTKPLADDAEWAMAWVRRGVQRGDVFVRMIIGQAIEYGLMARGLSKLSPEVIETLNQLHAQLVGETFFKKDDKVWARKLSGESRPIGSW